VLNILGKIRDKYKVEIALRSLLQRPWLERVWVLLEVGVSLNATVVCGEHSMEWESFEGAIMSKGHLTDLRLSIGGQFDRVLRVGLIEYICFSCHEPESPGAQLATLLQLEIHSKASDLRDLVYALLGLVRTPGIVLPKNYYTLSVAEVFKEAVRSSLLSADDVKSL
jgi:hypothetical protein